VHFCILPALPSLLPLHALHMNHQGARHSAAEQLGQDLQEAQGGGAS
jgi:hypothetical protein